MAARVAIVDDHALLADAVATALSLRGVADVSVIDPSGPASEVLGAVLATEPDIALVDVVLGDDRSGLGLVQPLVDAGVRVVVVTASPEAPAVREVARTGVVVVDKAQPFHEVLDQVVGEVPDPLAALTPAERTVLGALFEGWTAAEIAERQGTSITTTRSHIRAVLMKLGVGTQLAAVAVARRSGWTSPGVDSPQHPQS